MRNQALLLAGHGSHISAETAGLVWSYVDRLRHLGVADEIGACFWKEPPAFSQVLETIAAAEVVVVPVFTAQGYFTGEVIPGEFGLNGTVTERAGQRIHLTASIGEHLRLESIVETRLRAAAAEHRLDPAETAAVIIGHGTPRNRRSRAAARQQAAQIRALDYFSEVLAVYLDDEPNIPSIYRSTRARNIIALPWFLAQGSHVTQDVPRALGLAGGPAPEQVQGRVVVYCESIGSDESIFQVILDLARGTGFAFAERKDAGVWDAFPKAGRETLLRALASGKTLTFGQLLVNRERVWHKEGAAARRVFSAPAALRQYVREAPFRPLPSSADMPGGWQVNLSQPAEAHAVIETVYPGLIADWAARQTGQLASESLAQLGARQRGMFKNIGKLPRAAIEKTVAAVCGNCIRQPAWWHGAVSAGLPCRAACNYWLSTAVKAGETAL